MPVLTQPPSMGDVLKYELNPNYTREVVTLAAGMPYPVGSVLGKITASGKHTLSSAAGSDGAETTSGVPLIGPIESDTSGLTGTPLTGQTGLPY